MNKVYYHNNNSHNNQNSQIMFMIDYIRNKRNMSKKDKKKLLKINLISNQFLPLKVENCLVKKN